MEKKMVQFSKAIDNLAEEMGAPLFADIVDFDMEVSEARYEYKILMGRRFCVLYTGLEPLIKYNYGEDFNATGCFVTNLSIALKDLEDHTILIVDDTLLHGRAVKKLIADLIACGCKRENISVKVYLRNEDAKIVDQSLLALSEYKRLKNSDMWRLVSSKIVDAFMGSGWPYMYYLPYYETSLHSDIADRIGAFLDEKQLRDNAVLHQERHGISSYLYCSENSMHICREVLFRFYKYEKADKLIVIPYAYLKPLTFPQIAEAFEIFEDKEMIQYQGNGAFLRDSHALEASRLKMQYAYSLLTYICSLMQSTLFMRSLGLEDWERADVIEKTSLGCHISLPERDIKDISGELEKISAVGMDDLPLEENGDINDVINSLLLGRSSSAEQNEMNADYFLDHYLKLSSKRDEELAGEEKERMRGIEAERIFKYVPDRKDVWRKLTEVIDTGRGTLAAGSNVIGETTYVDSLLYAGEQNHACNEENLAPLIYPVLQYDMYCEEKGISSERKKEVKAKLIDKIMERRGGLRDKISLHEIEVIKEETFAQNYGAYYFARYPMFRNDAGVKLGMKTEKEYEYR